MGRHTAVYVRTRLHGGSMRERCTVDKGMFERLVVCNLFNHVQLPNGMLSASNTAGAGQLTNAPINGLAGTQAQNQQSYVFPSAFTTVPIS